MANFSTAMPTTYSLLISALTSQNSGAVIEVAVATLVAAADASTVPLLPMLTTEPSTWEEPFLSSSSWSPPCFLFRSTRSSAMPATVPILMVASESPVTALEVASVLRRAEAFNVPLLPMAMFRLLGLILGFLSSSPPSESEFPECLSPRLSLEIPATISAKLLAFASPETVPAAEEITIGLAGVVTLPLTDAGDPALAVMVALSPKLTLSGSPLGPSPEL